MDKVNYLSKEWKEWVLENIAQGCTPESMIEVMVKSNFSPSFAENVVLDYLKNPNNEHKNIEAEKSAGKTYIYENSRFNHPGHVIQTSDRQVNIAARLEKPVVAILEGFLSSEECEALIEHSKKKLKRSLIVNPETGESEEIKERTSYGTFFNRNENDFITKIERRISEVMDWPAENGEPIQILNYQVGAEYRPHFDYFTGAGSEKHKATGGQRVSTLVMYLNDVELGGETTFPEVGLAAAPKKGSAVYFEYYNNHGQVDPLTLHAGAPVLKGEKWIATKWMRENKYSK